VEDRAFPTTTSHSFLTHALEPLDIAAWSVGDNDKNVAEESDSLRQIRHGGCERL
jgi:hypothetical protein